jgi:hypothetical protein
MALCVMRCGGWCRHWMCARPGLARRVEDSRGVVRVGVNSMRRLWRMRGSLTGRVRAVDA